MRVWKETAAVSAAALLGLFLLPLALAREPAAAAPAAPEPVQRETMPPETPAESAPQAHPDRERTLRVLDGDAVREMTPMLDRLAADPAFGMTREELDGVMEPSLYIGRCREQVERLLEEYAPLLAEAQVADGAISL